MSAAPSITEENLARILDPEPLDIEQLRGWLGVTQEEFASAVGRSPRTIARWKAQRQPATRASAELARSLRKLARIRFLLDDLIGQDRARAWLRTPNPGFRGSAPIDMLAEGRHDEIVAVLEALADGGAY